MAKTRYKFNDPTVESLASGRAQTKRSRREAVIFKAIAEVTSHTFVDTPVLSGVFVSNVSMSKKSGLCLVTFGTLGLTIATEKKRILDGLNKLKGPIRSIVARALEGAWCPEVAIELDQVQDKVAQLNQKICQAMEDDQQEPKSINEIIQELQRSIDNSSSDCQKKQFDGQQ